MSDVMASMETNNYIEELQIRFFEECIKKASKTKISRSTNNSDDISLSSSLLEAGDPKIVPISVIIDCISRSFVSVPHFRFIFLSKRLRNEFLEELRRSLQRKSNDGERVAWWDFRDGSRHWFFDLLNASNLDNNNGRSTEFSSSSINNNGSEAPTSTEISERDALSAGERSCGDAACDDDFSSSITQLDTMATCYSFNSSMELGTTDSMIEYSDETDQMDENISVDLQIRLRRHNEEISNLKAELLRAEETISNLESDLKSRQITVERISDKYVKLQKELEEHKDMFVKLEKQEETCRQEMRFLEKSYNALQKKVAELEKEKEDIANLNARIEDLSKKNVEYVKQLAECKAKYNEKIIEYDYIQETYNELQTSYCQLEKNHEKILKEHLIKIEELQLLKSDLQRKLNVSADSSSSQRSVTPPPYAGTHLHSTPYNNKKLSRHDSLYTELKSSGINMDETKVHELKEELSFYNEEITSLSDKIDEALQSIAASRNEICAPNVQLVETNVIQSLKHRVTTLLNTIKNCPAAMEPPVPLMGEESREKPDVLPKKGSYVFSDRDFASDKGENDLIASVPNIVVNGVCHKSVPWQPLPEISGVEKLDVSDDNENEKHEVFIPIKEALNRINELNEIYPGTDKLPPPNPRHKSIFTSTVRKPTWSDLIEDLREKDDATFCMKPKPSFANPLSSNNTPSSDMKTLKNDTTSSQKGFESSPDSTPIPKLDTRYVTMTRPCDTTYLLNPIVSSTVDKSTLQQQSSFDEIRSEIPYRRTPDTSSPKPGPKRKLSVYHRSFDVDSLQTPDKGVQIVINSEKKRSISTPDAQETKSLHAKQSSPLSTKDQLTNYRCLNNSAELSDSSSSKPDDSLTKELEDSVSPMKEEKMEVPRTAPKKPIIAPTRFKVPDTTVNETTNELEFTPIVGRGILSKNAENDDAQNSRILSSSANLVKKEENSFVDEAPTMTLDNSTVDSFVLELDSMDISNNNSTKKCKNASSKLLRPNNQVDENTCNKKGANDDYDDETQMRKTTSSSGAAAVASTAAETAREDCKSCGDASDGVTAARSSRVPPAVGRAMSSGEDSSAESECDARKNAQPESSAQPAIETGDEPQEEQPDKTRSEDRQDPGSGEDKVKTPPIMNGDAKESSGQKVTINSSPPDVIKEEESPEAFPSWTDDKLQESGIASFPDIDLEISEILNEEQLKKKCTAFSIGLSADRMTLSKRMDLAVRRRNQSEQNFANEVKKMQLDIKEVPRQRNSVSGRAPGVRRPSLCFEVSKWEIEKLDRTDSSNSITELREIFEQTESRRHSREENNNLLRTSVNNLSTITTEHAEEEEVWSNPREDIAPDVENNNEANPFASRQQYRHPLICWLVARYFSWRPMLWGIFIAFMLGVIVTRVVSSSKRNGPPLSWWSLEEILSQYIHVENARPRAI